MRKLNYLLVTLTLCMFWGCSDKNDSALSVSSDTLSFPYNGGTQTLTVNGDGQWSISELPAWLRASMVSGTGINEVTLTADANPEKEDRESNIVVYTTDGSHKYYVTMQQYGRHVCPIMINRHDEMVFGGRKTTQLDELGLKSLDDFFTVTCDTEWKIEGPSWITAVFNGRVLDISGKTNYSGSGSIYLMTNDIYTGEDTRRDKIYLKTFSGESQVIIPVAQLGKDEIYCNRLHVANSGFISNYKIGSNVERLMALVVLGDELSNTPSYNDFNSRGHLLEASPGYTPQLLINTSLQLDKDYTVFVIGGDADYNFAPSNKIYRYKFHSLKETDLYPRVEIKNVKYEGGKWYWTVCPNEYTSVYSTIILDKSSCSGLSYQFLSLYYSYMFKYFGDLVPVFISDSEKEFSMIEDDALEDKVIVAIPFGKNVTPSICEVFVSQLFN